MVGKKRRAAGGKAAAAASTRNVASSAAAATPQDDIDEERGCCLAVVLSRLLDIASSSSRSVDVLQAFCDQKCVVDVDQVSSDTSSSPSSSRSRKQQSPPALPHYDCYWIILGTTIINRLLVLKDAQRKKIDKTGTIFACLGAIADAIATILLQDKARLDKASQSSSTAGPSRSILCRAILSTTLSSLYILQKYDLSDQDHETIDNHGNHYNTLQASMEALYRMVFLKPSELGRSGATSEVHGTSSEETDVLKMDGIWPVEELKLECEQVEQLFGASIKLEKTCVKCLLEALQIKDKGSIDPSITPPPTKRPARARRGVNKPNSSKTSEQESSPESNLGVDEVVSAFNKLLASKDSGPSIDGRATLRRWSSIAVVWSQSGSGQAELLLAAHRLAETEATAHGLSSSLLSSLMYRAMLVAAEVGAQCGARPAATTMDQYIKFLSSSFGSGGSTRGKKAKAVQRSDIRDITTLVIYDFLQNHKDCLKDVEQSGAPRDVVDVYEHGAFFLAPRFDRLIVDLCDSASAAMINASYDEREDCNRSMLILAAGHVLSLVADPSLPLDCNLTTFAFDQVARCINRIGCVSSCGGRESRVQDLTFVGDSQLPSDDQRLEQLKQQYDLNKPLPSPSIDEVSKPKCTFAGVLREIGQSGGDRLSDERLFSTVLRALHCCADDDKSPFRRLFALLVDVLRHVYNTRDFVDAPFSGSNLGEQPAETKKRKASTRGEESTIRRKGNRRRRTNVSRVDVDGNVAMWRKITAPRAAVAVEAFSCLKGCFLRIQRSDSIFVEMMRKSASSSDLACLVGLGDMLDNFIFGSRLQESSTFKDDPGKKREEASLFGIDDDLSGHEISLWDSHMSMVQALGCGQSTFDEKCRLDGSVWGGKRRIELYDSIAATMNEGGEKSTPRLSSACHVFLAANMLIVSDGDTRDAERRLAGAYVLSISDTLANIQKQSSKMFQSECLASTLHVPLCYDDARTLMLAFNALQSVEQWSHLRTLTKATSALLKLMNEDESVKIYVSQNEARASFVARVLVVISSLKQLLCEKEAADVLRGDMHSFCPTLDVDVVAKRFHWTSQNISFLGVYGTWKNPFSAPSSNEHSSALISATGLDNLRRLFEMAFRIGFETAAHDRGRLVFTAWNCLAQPQYSPVGGLVGTPSLKAVESDCASSILRMREDLYNVYGALGRGKPRTDDVEMITPSRLKVVLKLMMIQAKEAVDELIRRFIPEDDDIKQQILPSAVALMTALPSYISAVLACYTEHGSDSLSAQIQPSEGEGRRRRGYSSESDLPPSDVDSDKDHEEDGFDTREDALFRLKECCESFGGAPVHPDWLISPSLRDGIHHADVVEVAEMAMQILTKLASFSLKQCEKHQLGAFSRELADNSPLAKKQIRLGLSFLRWVRKNAGSTSDSVYCDLKRHIAAVTLCPITILEQILDNGPSQELLKIREHWCPVSGRSLPGLLQDGNRLFGSWNVSQAELRAGGEWELLLSEAISMACVDFKEKLDCTDCLDLLLSSDVVAARTWWQVLSTCVSHLVPSASLIHLGVGGDRQPHPFSTRRNLSAPKRSHLISFSEPLSKNGITTPSLLSSVSDTLYLVAKVGATKTDHSICSICDAVATHLVCDTSSFAALQHLLSIESALETLTLAISLVEAAPKRDVKRDSVARLIDVLVSAVEEHGKAVPKHSEQTSVETPTLYAHLHDYIFAAGTNTMETVVGEPFQIISVVNDPKYRNWLYKGNSEKEVPILDGKQSAVHSLVKVLSEESLHASSRSRGICTLLLNRIGSLQVRMHSASMLQSRVSSILPSYVEAFDKMEKKSLKAIVQKDLVGLRATFPSEFEKELSALLQLLLTNGQQASFASGKFITESLLKTFDFWKKIPFQSKIHMISVSILYAARYDKLDEIGSFLMESASNFKPSKNSSSCDSALLSSFFGSLVELQTGPFMCESLSLEATTSLSLRDHHNLQQLNLPTVCTFIQKSGFHEQPWLTCETCDLVNDRGVCSLCALVCHRGHKLVYSRKSSFFCDCGAEGGTSSLGRVRCKCLTPLAAGELKRLSEDELGEFRQTRGVSLFDKIFRLGRLGQLTPAEIAHEFFKEDTIQSISRFKTSAVYLSWFESLLGVLEKQYRQWKEALGDQFLLQNVEVEKEIGTLTGRIPLNILRKNLRRCRTDVLPLDRLNEEEMVLVYSATGFQAKYSSDSATQTVAMARLWRNEISRNVIACDSRGRAVVAETKELVFMCLLPTTARHVKRLCDQPISRQSMTILGATQSPFSVVGLQFSCNERLLLAWGTSQVSVLVVNSSFNGIDVTVKLSFDLDGDDHILKCEWLPDSQSNIAVSSSRFVRLYDIEQVESKEVSTGRNEYFARPVVGYSLGHESRLRDVSVVPQDPRNFKRGFSPDVLDQIYVKKVSKMYLLLENGRLHCLDIETINGKIHLSELHVAQSRECISIPTSSGRFAVSATAQEEDADTNSLGEGSNIQFLGQSRILLYQCKSNAALAFMMSRKGDVGHCVELLPWVISAEVLGSTDSVSGPFTRWTELGVVFRSGKVFFRLSCVGRTTTTNQLRLLCIEFNESLVRVKSLQLFDDSLDDVGTTSLEGLAAFSAPVVDHSVDGRFVWAGERVFLVTMTSNGNFWCLGDHLIDLVPVVPEEVDDAQLRIPMKIISLPLKVPDIPRPPLTIFQRLFNISATDNLIVLSHGLGMAEDDLKERMSLDSSLNLICPREGCSIAFSLKPNNYQLGQSSLAISAVRILVGSSSGSFPNRLTVQGREVRVSHGKKAWYNFLLTDEEVALGIRTGYVSVCVSSSQDLNHPPMIDAIEILGESRSIKIPRSYFDSAANDVYPQLPPLETAATTSDLPFENVVVAMILSSKILGEKNSNVPVPDDAKNAFWELVEGTVATSHMGLVHKLRELALVIEPDELQMQKQLDEKVLIGCTRCLDALAQMVIRLGDGMTEESSEVQWRSIHKVVQDCIKTVVAIAKRNPITFLQSLGNMVGKDNTPMSIAAAVSNIVTRGRTRLTDFDELTTGTVDLLLTEVALVCLSNESTKCCSDSPSLETLKDYLESPNEDVVEECCSAICSFFEEHRRDASASGNTDMFQQLQAARLVAYQCDACQDCPIKDVRYTIPEQDEGIDLCRQCYHEGMNFTKSSPNPRSKVEISGGTVGSERPLTCKDIKRLKPVLIEKLEIAAAGGNQNTEGGEQEVTVGEMSSGGLETFLGRVFVFLLERLPSSMRGDDEAFRPIPLLNLLLELIHQSKAQSHELERINGFATILTKEITNLLEDHEAVKPLQSPSFLVKVGTAIRCLARLTRAAYMEDEDSKPLAKQARSRACSVHGIPAVRRRCARGPNKNRRFYVCGMEKEQRCDFFVWADSSDDQAADENELMGSTTRQIGRETGIRCYFNTAIRNSLWKASSLADPLHVRLCCLFEDEFLPEREGKEDSTKRVTSQQKYSRTHNPLESCRYTIHSAESEYNDGVLCSKERLKGFLSPQLHGGDTMRGKIFHYVSGLSEAEEVDDRLNLFESVLGLVTRIADYKTVGIQRWLSLLCDLALSLDASSLLRRISISAMHILCGKDHSVYRSIRDCHAFQFYLKRIYRLASGVVASALIVKKKAYKCRNSWSCDAVQLLNENAFAFVGTDALISEDSLSEHDRKSIGKALDELWAAAKNRGNNWRQFCGLPSLPESFGTFEIQDKNDLRERCVNDLKRVPPIVALFWMASSCSGSNQLKMMKLIDFALYKDHPEKISFFPNDLVSGDEGTSIQQTDPPEKILTSSPRKLHQADVVAFSVTLVCRGKSPELRKTAAGVISKVFNEVPHELKRAVFRNLFPPIMDIGALGKACMEFLTLLQVLSSRMDSCEEIMVLGSTLLSAFQRQYDAISCSRCNSEGMTLESSSGSPISKRKFIDFSRCIFCAQQSLSITRGSANRILSRRPRLISEKKSTDGETPGKTSSSHASPLQRKWHRDQISPFHRQRLEAEKTSSDFSLYFRLKYRIVISDIHMTISDPRGRYAKTVHIYYSPRPTAAANVLKEDNYILNWQRCATLKLSRGVTRVNTSFSLPVVASNLKIDFVEFFDRPGEGTKAADGSIAILCPRCTTPVTNAHGVCGRCGDAVFQCRKCRHINYDRLDGFFCAECGYCPMGSFSFEVTAGVGSNAVAITNDDDFLAAEKMLGATMTIEEDLRGALREKIRKHRNEHLHSTPGHASIFNEDMNRAFMGLPPALTDDSNQLSASALLERFGTPGAVVKAIACPEADQRTSSGSDRSERARSLLNLARQIRNSSGSSSDRRSAARGINLDNLEEMLESANVYQSNTDAEQPNATETSNSKSEDRSTKKNSELEMYQKLLSQAREAEKECAELRCRLDAWKALNSGSVSMATIQSDDSPLIFPSFLPSDCFACSEVICCGLLELWSCLLKVGPTQLELNEEIVETLLREEGGVSYPRLLDARKKTLVSIATSSETGAELVLKILRRRMTNSQDRLCADILGKILKEDNFPMAAEFTKFALEILSSHGI